MSEEERVSTKPSPAARRGKPAALGLGAGVAIGGGATLLIALFSMDTVATRIARGQLAERGIVCDARFHVDVAMTLGSAVIAPSRCDMAEGAVESIELVDPVDVELSGLAPTRIEAPSLRMVLRIEPPVPLGGPGLGGVLDTLHIPERIGGLARALAQLSQEELPEHTHVARCEVRREGQIVAALSDVTLRHEAALDTHVARVDLPSLGALGVRADVGGTELRGAASADTVTLDGTLHANASVPLLGSIEREGAVHIEVTHLETDSPRLTLSF